MAIKKIVIFILVIAAFGAGIYFRDDALKFYSGLTKQVEGLQKTDLGQIISEVQKQVLTATPLNVGGASNKVVLLQSKIIEETNFQRMLNQSAPLVVLKESAKLDEAAAAKANDMFLNQYFEHVSPSGVNPGQLVQDYGYDYIVTGENLILGNFSSEKEVVQNWMDSPGHKANILNNRYTEIGVAVIKGTYKGQTVWIGVQEFGLPLSTCSSPDEGLKDQINLYKMQLDEISSQISGLKIEIDNTNPRSASYRQMINDYNQLIGQYNSFAEQVKQSVAKYNNQVSVFNACVAGK